jgi:transcriptional regulator with XRE-family HTH domain
MTAQRADEVSGVKAAAPRRFRHWWSPFLRGDAKKGRVKRREYDCRPRESSTVKRADNTDKEVGLRIRMLRISKNISQEELGVAAGVTFQQVQKYENGTNRVSPGRLQRIATCLRVPVSDFYPSMDEKPQLPKSSTDFDFALLQSPEAVKLLRHFATLRPEVQRTAVAVIGAIAATTKA